MDEWKNGRRKKNMVQEPRTGGYADGKNQSRIT
jgi:hypothetical protein